MVSVSLDLSLDRIPGGSLTGRRRRAALAGKYSAIWAGVAGLAPGAPGFQLDANARFKDVAVLIMAGEKEGLISSVQRLNERMKSLNIAHEYKELPRLDCGGIIMGGMSDVFEFFSQHIKREP